MSSGWLAGLSPLLLYGLLAAVTRGYYAACCGGMPDHGPVPIQELPLLLLWYRPFSPDLWMISTLTFILPGFVAGCLARRSSDKLLAAISFAAILAHAAALLWRYHTSHIRFLAELWPEEWGAADATSPTTTGVGFLGLLLGAGYLIGRLTRRRAVSRRAASDD